jgi:hypothetical protein
MPPVDPGAPVDPNGKLDAPAPRSPACYPQFENLRRDIRLLGNLVDQTTDSRGTEPMFCTRHRLLGPQATDKPHDR